MLFIGEQSMKTLALITIIAFLIAGGPVLADDLPQQVLIVLTNTAQVPDSERPTGVWASEYTDPYEVFTNAGFEVHVASPKGGRSPVDPRSGSDAKVHRIPSAWQKMQQTIPLADINARDYAAIFLAGGHGTMWDFPNEPNLVRVVSDAIALNRPVGAVCHGPAGLIGATTTDGRPLLAGRRVNSFTNAEERAAGMTDVVPFLLEDRLRELGGEFASGGVFQRFMVEDRGLITGQNPASADAVATRIVEMVQRNGKP
jgi:putative intracellular protease/amidase